MNNRFARAGRREAKAAAGSAAAARGTRTRRWCWSLQNGLAIDALALAAGMLDEPRFLEAAARGRRASCGNRSAAKMAGCTTWRHGRASGEGFLDDYAWLLNCLITLYEAI